MSWIDTLPYEEAGGRLKRAYDRVRGPSGQIDNILRLHSLRPHTLEAHLALYKSVLHHTANRLPAWLLEAIGVYVSLLNRCDYCLEHHFAGLKRLLEDEARAAGMRGAMESGRLEQGFAPREVQILRYAERLTREPAAVEKSDIGRLRDAGLDDGEILEVNQVVSYFAYANRTVQGLGGSAEGELLGLSPAESEDLGNWEHA